MFMRCKATMNLNNLISLIGGNERLILAPPSSSLLMCPLAKAFALNSSGARWETDPTVMHKRNVMRAVVRATNTLDSGSL